MWDYASMEKELNQIGFVKIRPCSFNDCEDSKFKQVEALDRFKDSVAIEARK